MNGSQPIRIAVVDGQGGGIGKRLVELLRRDLPEAEIIALGTNSLATAVMLKAGANEGATGENAVVQTSAEVGVIVGAISIILANSMLGEVTPRMAKAVAASPAVKVLLPINRSRVEIIGVEPEPLPHQITRLVQRVKEMIFV